MCSIIFCMFFISLLLALAPIIAIRLQYFFSKKDKVLSQYENHWTTYKGDYVFVPLNFIFLYSFSPTLKTTILAFLFSLAANIIQHYIFVKMYSKPNSAFHMVNTKKQKLSRAGWVHLIFSTFQLTILITALFSPIVTPWFYLYCLNVFAVSIMFLVGSKKIHKKVIFYDIFISFVLFAATITKVLFILL